MSAVRRAVLGAGLVAAAALGVGGCGGTEGASTPAATTSTTATTTTAPPSTSVPPTATVTPATRPGSKSIGKQVFQANCSGCHAGGGTRAAFGPKLAGKGLTRDVIRATIRNGRGQMPAGRATGQDFEDVVAYVASLQ